MSNDRFMQHFDSSEPNLQQQNGVKAQNFHGYTVSKARAASIQDKSVSKTST
jgi:hypothetical protein